MPTTTRLTVTVEKGLADRVREASGGNISRFVSKAIVAQLQEERRRKLREELAAGYVAKADEDLEICREWDVIESEFWAGVDRQ
jgi:post-segregation antitoxin (ccd killing protein)